MSTWLGIFWNWPPRLLPSPKYLCDEIILEILIRLPAKDVLRYRSVCRGWKAMTTTPDFVELHRKRSVPTIIIERLIYLLQPEEIETELIVHRKVYLFDSIFEAEESKTGTTRMINENIKKVSASSARYNSSSRVTNPRFCFSSEGLIVLNEDCVPTLKKNKCIILNPITQEQVTVFIPGGSPYGIFLHPFAKDKNHYCLLFGGMLQSCFQFYAVDLGGSPIQTPPPMMNYDVDDVDGSINFYQPRLYSDVIVDDVMYWMVEICYRRYSSSSEVTIWRPRCKKSIMAYDIKAQNFSMIPHPRPQSQDQWYCKGYSNHRRMHLVGMDGVLCLCEGSSIAPLINIWISKEEQNGGEHCYHVANRQFLWIRWHTVNIDIDICHYPFNLSNNEAYDVTPASAVINGKLLLEWRYRGLFAFNLKLGTVRRLVTRIEHEVNSRIWLHIPSLVPITNGRVSNHEIWVNVYNKSPVSISE